MNLVRQRLGHVFFLAMAIGIGLAVFAYLVALPFRAFRKDHQAVVAGIVLLVGEQEIDELVQIHLVFGDAAANGCYVRRVERREAGIAAKDAKNTDALVRSHRGSLARDGIGGA